MALKWNGEARFAELQEAAAKQLLDLAAAYRRALGRRQGSRPILQLGNSVAGVTATGQVQVGLTARLFTDLPRDRRTLLETLERMRPELERLARRQ